MFREYTRNGSEKLKKTAVYFEEGAAQPWADGGGSRLTKGVVEFLVPGQLRVERLQCVAQFLEEGHKIARQLKVGYPNVRSPP